MLKTYIERNPTFCPSTEPTSFPSRTPTVPLFEFYLNLICWDTAFKKAHARTKRFTNAFPINKSICKLVFHISGIQHLFEREPSYCPTFNPSSSPSKEPTVPHKFALCRILYILRHSQQFVQQQILQKFQLVNPVFPQRLFHPLIHPLTQLCCLLQTHQ